jgi:hypothetical protein
MGAASDSTSKGARSVTEVTVAGQESVIQKYLRDVGGETRGAGRVMDQQGWWISSAWQTEARGWRAGR